MRDWCGMADPTPAMGASLLGLLLAACAGGHTGRADPDTRRCPYDTPSPSAIMARFAGRYASPVSSAGVECPPKADAALGVEIESDFGARKSIQRTCGTALLPV